MYIFIPICLLITGPRANDKCLLLISLAKTKFYKADGSMWIFKPNMPVRHFYYNNVAIYEHILKTLNFILNE